jgi:hypothetical protein
MPATAVQAIDPWDTAPIDRPSLAAFKDLGLTDAQVASYYRVPQHEVAMLRAAYGIADRDSDGHQRRVQTPPPPLAPPA